MTTGSYRLSTDAVGLTFEQYFGILRAGKRLLTYSARAQFG